MKPEADEARFDRSKKFTDRLLWATCISGVAFFTSLMSCIFIEPSKHQENPLNKLTDLDLPTLNQGIAISSGLATLTCMIIGVVAVLRATRET